MKLFKPFFDFFINLLTHLDENAFAPLKPHVGKIIGIEIKEFSKILYFTIDENKLSYLPELPPNHTIDTAISGHLSDFVCLWKNAKNQSSLNAKIHIHGDMMLAESFHRVFSEIDVDWEEKMASVLGDTLAFQLGEVARNTQGWGKDFMSHRAEDMTEFLQHEKKLLPTQDEVNDFCQDVDKLRDDTERLLVKIQRLESQSEN